jgi:NAD(P)-dependent dehydrogenase (short-subunit alcohol dehydrogenase family)
MSNKKVWFVTGAGRGMGVDFVKAALAAGLMGFEFCTAYAASKFGLEGWMESLRAEIAPFGSRPPSSSPDSSARNS